MDQGRIRRVPDKRRKAVQTVRSRRPWVKRRRSGLKPDVPGDILQSDTLTVTPKQRRPVIKQFNPVDPVGKWACSQAFRSVTAKNGREFLGKVVKDIPFVAAAESRREIDLQQRIESSR